MALIGYMIIGVGFLSCVEFWVTNLPTHKLWHAIVTGLMGVVGGVYFIMGVLL